MPQPLDALGRAIPVLSPSGVSERLTVQGTANATTTMTPGVARLSADVDCHYAVNGNATTSSPLLPGGTVEMINLRDGEQVSVVRKAADGIATVTRVE